MALIDNLIDSYHMNGDWLDSVGSNDGIPTGATFDTVNKKLGSASGNFDGIDDFVDIGSSLGAALGFDMSISCWVRFTALSGNNTVVIGSRNGAANLGFEVGALNDGKIILQSFGSSSLGYRFGTSNVGDNSFHHAVAVRDGINYYIYIDGSREDGTFQTLAGSTASPANTFIGDSDAPGNLFKGQIDEINIWDRALSASEVTELWNGGAGIELPAAIVAGNGVIANQFLLINSHRRR